MPDLPHLDDVTGALARVIQVLRPAPRNTLDRLSVYEGKAIETLFPAPKRLPAVERRPRWRLPGLVSEDLSFASLHEPLEPAFRRYYHARRRRIHSVYARSIRPDTHAHRPRLLYIHGYMQPETFIEEFALLASMAQVLQMEVVQLQPPYHGRRKPRSARFDGELYWTADLVQSVEALRQTLLDARTLLSIMRKESQQPVGVAGLSLGGALTAALTCLEPGFAFSAPFIAHMDLGALVADAPVLGAMRADLQRFGWTPRDFGSFTQRLGWNDLRPVIPPERIRLFAAKDDHFFRASVVRAMWRRWGKPKIHWYPTSHMGFITHLPDAVARLRAFVDELDLGAPVAPAGRRARRRAPAGAARGG
jgi:dienelactone hydrolase